MSTAVQGLAFQGLNVLITGGASGIGEACVRRFAREGAHVFVADIDEAGAQRVASDVEHGEALVLDVTSEESWRATRERVTPGGLDVLVNNAGIGDMASIEDSTLEGFQRLMRVNVDSVFLGCHMLLPALAKSTRGAIINMSSVAGIIAAGNLAGYNASKAAVRHLSKSVALHCAKKGYPVTCNSVHPSFVNTPILDPLKAKHGDVIYEKLAKQIPLGRLGTVEEIAGAVAFLASMDARFMTGAELVIDGGLSAS